MKVSIIVPVYNTEEQILRKCLDSLLSQTLSDIEILVVDDGSCCSCAAVCDKYSEVCSYVKVVHTKNQGVSAARNTGISLASGDYFMFVDADDWLEADATAKYYTYAQTYGLDILLSGCMLVERGRCTASYVAKDMLFTHQHKVELQRTILDNNPEYLRMWPMSPWAKLFRAEFIHTHGLAFTVGLKRMQDNLFCLQALEQTDRVGYLAYGGYYYRQTGDSVCHKFNPDFRQICESVLMHFKEFAMTSAEQASMLQAYYVKGIIILISEYTRLYYLHPDNPNSRKQLYKEYKRMCKSDPYQR
jgi:glycosyltransferase involved in cell wall biosynthesis|nr:glycosyltransferase [uncultured Acetatifactor sp.]